MIRGRPIAVTVVACLLLMATTASARQGDPWLGRDKVKHFAAGSLLAAGSYSVSALVAEDRRKRVAAGFVVGIGAGAVKEWRDRATRRGTPSWRDFTWSALGSVTGVTIAWLIDRAS